MGCPLLPAGCHVSDPGVHPQRLLESSLQCCSDQPLWEGGEIRKQETVVNPAGLQQSHLVSLQLGPPYSGGLLGSAQLSTPPLPAWAGPSSHAYMGCGVSAPWPCPANGGQRSSEDARQCCGEGCTLPGGLRGECNLWSPPWGLQWVFTLAASHPCWQTQKRPPLCRTHRCSRCPSRPCPVFSPYSVPRVPAPDLEGWIPGLPWPLVSDWVGQWEAGSESRGRRSGRIGCSFPGSCLCLSSDPRPLHGLWWEGGGPTVGSTVSQPCPHDCKRLPPNHSPPWSG